MPLERVVGLSLIPGASSRSEKTVDHLDEPGNPAREFGVKGGEDGPTDPSGGRQAPGFDLLVPLVIGDPNKGLRAVTEPDMTGDGKPVFKAHEHLVSAIVEAEERRPYVDLAGSL
jgi:hypothetical protein